MFTLIISNKEGYTLNIQDEDFDALKLVAQNYNKKGYDVKIVKSTCVYEVRQYEN